MCLLIHKPKGVNVDEEILRAAAFQNGDGWGIASIEDGKVVVQKGLKWDKDKIGKESPLHYLEGLKDRECVIHFRMASKGDVTIENAHPIWTGVGDVWIAHNGTMPGWGEAKYKEGKSDTKAFAEFMGILLGELKLGEEAVWDADNAIWNAFATFMGGGNKMAVITPRGVKLFNPASGKKLDNGIWVSNQSYLYHYEGGYASGHGYGRVLDLERRVYTPVSTVSRQPLTHTPKVCVKCGYCGCTPCTASSLSGRCDEQGRWHNVKCPKATTHSDYCQGMTHYISTAPDKEIICNLCAGKRKIEQENLFLRDVESGKLTEVDDFPVEVT